MSNLRLSRPVALLLAALFGALAVASPSLALLVRPVVIDLTSTGSTANGQIEVVNDRNRPVTIELKANSFELPEQGAYKLGPDAQKDFVIFPTIAQLKPGARQVFRVRYIGEPNPASSKLYMFTSSELPVSEAGSEGAGSGANIEVLYSISTVVGVRAPRAKAAISVAAIDRVAASKDKDGKPLPAGLRITFANRGPAHGYVGGAVLDLTSGGWRKAVDTNSTAKAFGLGLIPANARRALFLPLDAVPATGAIAAQIKASAEG